MPYVYDEEAKMTLLILSTCRSENKNTAGTGAGAGINNSGNDRDTYNLYLHTIEFSPNSPPNW